MASPSPQDGVHPLNQYLNNPEGTTPSKGQFVEIVSNYEDDSTLLQFIHPPSNIDQYLLNIIQVVIMIMIMMFMDMKDIIPHLFHKLIQLLII